MTDDDFAPPPVMAPQPYPLWCAAVSEEETDIDVGRVVGWLPPETEYASGWREMVPVVATEDEYGRVANIYAAIQHDSLFFCDTRQDALERAVTWVNRPVRPFMYYVPQDPLVVPGDADAAMQQAVAAAERQHLRLDGPYDEVVSAELFGRNSGVMLRWERAVRVRQVRLEPSGQLVPVEPVVGVPAQRG